MIHDAYTPVRKDNFLHNQQQDYNQENDGQGYLQSHHDLPQLPLQSESNKKIVSYLTTEPQHDQPNVMASSQQ